MPDDNPDDGPQQKWSTYSDFEDVVSNVAERVELAIDAYGHLKACESQRLPVSDGTAIETKKALVGAGVRIKPEINVNRGVEPFDEIIERWEGEDGEPGHLELLQEADFIEEVPPWLDQYADDLTTAAWELGYLQAGAEEPADPDDTGAKVDEVLE